MEFFDKLGKKASEAYKVTADKTGKIAKEAKIRMHMGELKSQVKELKSKLEEIQNLDEEAILLFSDSEKQGIGKR